MKRLININILLNLMVLTLFFISCREGESLDREDVHEEQTPVHETATTIQAGEHIGSIRSAIGRVHFNADLGHWYIAVSDYGTYDSVTYYYAVSLEESFREENLEVVFSGEYYTAVGAPAVPAGYEIYVVELTDIEKKL